MVTPDILIAHADKIDGRLGPISGRDADRLAVVLREAAKQLAGIVHPTGSEQFERELAKLCASAPWRLCDEEVGEVLAADGGIVLTVDRARTTEQEASALALWIIMAVNTLAGFKAEMIPS